MKKLTNICLLFLLMGSSFHLLGQITPLPNAHAHNDYEHTRPLLDALDNGFTSVEADIYLMDGELYVSHNKPVLKDSNKTLRNLYLKPLAQRIKNNKGRVYPDYKGFFFLMIDFKMQGDAVYPVLKSQLTAFQEMICTVRDTTEESEKPVKIFISGSRPSQNIIFNDTLIWASLDGLPSELGKGISARLMPVVSTHYGTVLKWKGEGTIQPEELARLKDLVNKAHSEGKKVRLWAAPDTPQIWSFLLEQGVDLINTDKLVELNEFLGQWKR